MENQNTENKPIFACPVRSKTPSASAFPLSAERTSNGVGFGFNNRLDIQRLASDLARQNFSNCSMWYIYVLKSEKDGKLYTGYTHDLRERIKFHKEGMSKATKSRRPLVLIYYEAYLDKRDAQAREKWLKTGWGRNQLRKILKHSLET